MGGCSLINSIALPAADGRGPQQAWVVLRSGEELALELTGDLGGGNAGVLIFLDSGAEYVPWTDVQQIDLDGPPGM
jgi:hypothetical protein